MGWTHLPAVRTDTDATRAIRALYADSFEFLDWDLVGAHFWALLRRHSVPDTFIGLFILARCPHGDWIFKTMTEHDGPAADDCPLRFLARSPLPIPPRYSAEWRTRVLDLHHRRALAGSPAAARL